MHSKVAWLYIYLFFFRYISLSPGRLLQNMEQCSYALE